jgi:hypothetical protein
MEWLLMQQALEYAEILNIPFAFASNGDGFVFHDRTGTLPDVESTPLGGFPSPARLWSIYREWKGLDADEEQVVLQDYFDDGERSRAAVLPAQRNQRCDRGDCQRRGPSSARHGHWHWKDLHSVPDHMEALEGGKEEARALPG